jgi:anti-sigma factor RsiW
MSRQHVPDSLMQQFVEGEVDDKVAVAVALHLDACPACATRAAALEPLAGVFAATEDPRVPVGLVESIAVAVRAAERPGPEPALAAALMGLALCLLLLGGAPTEILASSATMMSASLTVVKALIAESGAFAPVWLVSATVATGAAFVVARNLEVARRGRIA